MDDSNNKRSWLFSLVAIVVALAAVAVVVAGVGSIKRHNDVADREKRLATGSLDATAAAANGDPKNRHLVLVSTNGKYQVEGVVGTTGNGFITGGNLPDADSGQTYQLWSIGGTKAVSLGIIGNTVKTTAFRLPASVDSLLITSESDSGAVSPSDQTIVSAALGE